MTMKTFATLTAFILTTTAVAEENKVPSQEEAAISTIVESVGTFADRGEFDALSRLYADEFVLDYSSLNGQEPTTKYPLQLMSEWAGVLPGFDRTRHALSDVEVQVTGSKATARADVQALHWIGELFWQVDGHYDYQLNKTAVGWKITSMTFNLERETGTRDVFGPAIAAAQKKELTGHKNSIAMSNKERVEEFFSTLENEDIQKFVDLFAEDGVQLNPYNSGVFPAGAKGKDELLKYWSPVPDLFDGMQFHIDEILATENPNVVFVRYRGEITLKDNAGVYRNDYYSTFRFNRDGKILEYVEIFNPVSAAKAFGLIEKLK